MAEAENKPSIRIHVDQQVTIEGVRGHEEVEDETVATEITGFDVEDDLYVLRGALSFSGFFRQEDEGDVPLPDAFEDRDVFDAGADVPEAPVLPFHHRLPFLLQVPVTAQEVHQRESGSLYVNPKIGQWNVHVLGEDTIHLRAELVLQGLSGQEGYVFRCGTQEEGVKPASSLDNLLEQEESRTLVPPAVSDDEEFDAPFDNAWASNYRQSLDVVEEPASEDDWLIESPAPDAHTAEAEYDADRHEDEEQAEEDEEDVILFTPDPRLVFPMPDAETDWAKELNAVEQAFPNGLPLQEQDLFNQAQAMFEQAQRQYPELQNVDFAEASREVMEHLQVSNFEDLQRSLFEQAQSPYANQFLNPYADPDQNHAYEADQYREVYDRAFDQYSKFQGSRPQEEVPSSSGTPSSSSSGGATADAYHEAYNRIVSSHGTPSPYDEDADAFVVEDARTEQLTELEDTFDAPEPFEAQEEETERPVLEVVEETVEATYEFEDEVPPQEIIAAAPEVVEPHVKQSGPKLSVGSKSLISESTGNSLKLSSLLGDSRTQPEAPEVVDAGYTESAQLTRESNTLGSIVSNNGANSSNKIESSDSIVSNNGGNIAAPLYTPQDAHDSVWGNFLRQKETKTTLKFRIVHEQDSLHELAEQYNTTPSDLQRANRLTRQEVETGQVLYIPTKRR
ncbi:LysM peptidoglycan-binding domain-containing protein [Tumebacillus sp. ITR2]|uniref:LysM peptidoglycan-binding domain-containing protein n=1 Tax=Tumebacillus amylolyticus TaxID=2801339 RepID=A0ABS1J9Y8_9BACL|nr:LysM peptidoglycan-binding domain-containing protein [Tumebacillus amylolyticus]